MKKSKYTYVKSHFSREISLALHNNFSAILLPLEDDYDPYYLDSELDLDDVYEIAEDLGWDRFYYIDFISKKELIIDLYELGVA